MEDISRQHFTGVVEYRGIKFTFSMVGEELRLIPPKEKEQEIEWEWGMTRLANGAYSFGKPLPVEEDYLVGDCNETRQKMVFIPIQGSYLGIINSTVSIKLMAYVSYNHYADTIDRISFTCPELNYIFPINQAYSMEVPVDDGSSGVIEIKTLQYDATTTDKQIFCIDEKEVSVLFGVSRTVSRRIEDTPLCLETALIFEFAPTGDFSFIIRLWRIAKDFIRFLCYRNNVDLPEIHLAAPYKDGKHDSFATLFFFCEEKNVELDTLKRGRYIKQVYISGYEGKILDDIAKGFLYLRHLPETYHIGRTINAARFIMITAAFEWEFRQSYPNGIVKSEKTKRAEETVTAHIQQCIEQTSGKEKDIYRFLRKLVKSDSLQTEIVQMGKDYSEILDVFGDSLYRQNGQTLNYSEMGARLSAQRNHFAHGDLDKDFIGLSLLDVVYMELVVYAMQLRKYGLEISQIQKAINDLFNLSFAL